VCLAAPLQDVPIAARTDAAVVSALSTIITLSPTTCSTAEDGVVGAAEDEGVDAGVEERGEVDFGDFARDVCVCPSLPPPARGTPERQIR
jgi:hypothetical protein